MNPDAFTVESARAAAGEDRLPGWVAAFLASPGSDNAVLAAALPRSYPFWLGPVEVPIDRLHRLAGPPGEPVLEAVDEDFWRDGVEDLAQKVGNGHEPPPVVATFQGDHLLLEDGNHRVEALRRAGQREAWTVVGFEHEADLEGFLDRAAELPA